MLQTIIREKATNTDANEVKKACSAEIAMDVNNSSPA
jgi:hypothetical protein